ncbi:hypothetical protein [Sulfurovum sp.]|uniref:hypothetical protein n=1 Tax=Sulfurovum sp. TaxID=1969726 RepID=UPI0028683326|nr:hypothetical protein [Sulfurovum sp.]
MTKENHNRLEALSPEGKDAYIAAKARILDVIGKMDLLEDVSLSEEEKSTIHELLDDTAFLMKTEEL